MDTQAPAEIPLHTEKKKFVRRLATDRSQRIRLIVQGLFVALNGWLGIQFFLWVRYYERGGQGLAVARPAGAEGWLPIAGLMNFKYFLSTGLIPAIHPAAMFLFVAFLLMSLFTLYTIAILLHFFSRVPCSCGGVIRMLTWPQHLVFNIGFTMIAWFSILLKTGRYPLFRKQKQSLHQTIQLPEEA